MPVKETDSLMPHQQKAVDKAFKSEGQILLTHSMGLGKTHTSVAIADNLRKKGKANKILAVVPASLRTNFSDNGVHKYTTDKATMFGTRSEPFAHVDDASIPDTPYYVVSYDMFKKEPHKYLDRTGADTLIVDEMHNFRNENTSNYRQMKEVRSRVKNFIGLTGTPFNNHPYDIVPLVNIVSDGKHNLGKNKEEFTRRFLTKGPIYDFRGNISNKFPDREKLKNKELFRKELDSWVHHAEQSDLPKQDVPEKLVQDIDVEMSPTQVQQYNFVMRKVPADVRALIRKGLPVNRKEARTILPMLMQARNVSNGVHYMDKRYSLSASALHTPKIKKVLDDVQQHLDETPDGQVIVHSHMIEGGVDVIGQGLKDRGIPYAMFTGKTSHKDREEAVKAYNKRKVRALVLSPAGVTGLNLPDTTMHVALDGHYNPAIIDQIEARGVRAGGLKHRQPKHRKVLVRRYRSVFPDTFFSKIGWKNKDYGVDEWVYGVARDKQDVNEQAMDVLRKTAAENLEGGKALFEKLRADLKGEHGAINMYQEHIDSIDDKEVTNKLKEIRDEEKVHVKELNELLDKKAALQAYHYSKAGKPPGNILDLPEKTQNDIVANMRKNNVYGADQYIDKRVRLEKLLHSEALKRLGRDKVKLDHPLYFMLGKDPDGRYKNGYDRYQIDQGLMPYSTFSVGDSFDYFKRLNGSNNLSSVVRDGELNYQEAKDLSKAEIEDQMHANTKGEYVEGRVWTKYKVDGNVIKKAAKQIVSFQV